MLKINGFDRAAILAAEYRLKVVLKDLEEERYNESQTVAESEDEVALKEEHYYQINRIREYYLRAIEILNDLL